LQRLLTCPAAQQLPLYPLEFCFSLFQQGLDPGDAPKGRSLLVLPVPAAAGKTGGCQGGTLHPVFVSLD